MPHNEYGTPEGKNARPFLTSLLSVPKRNAPFTIRKPKCFVPTNSSYWRCAHPDFKFQGVGETPMEAFREFQNNMWRR